MLENQGLQKDIATLYSHSMEDPTNALHSIAESDVSLKIFQHRTPGIITNISELELELKPIYNHCF